MRNMKIKCDIEYQKSENLVYKELSEIVTYIFNICRTTKQFNSLTKTKYVDGHKCFVPNSVAFDLISYGMFIVNKERGRK